MTTTTAKISGDAIYTQCFMKNPHVHIIHCSDSEILVKHGTRSRFSNVIKDEGRTKLLGKVLRAVSDPISLKALYEQEVVEERELDDARDLIEYLLKENVLISPDDYLPHVYLSMQFGKQIQPLTEKRIGLIGSGFIGSRLAKELGNMRVKELLVLDDREVRSTDPVFFDMDSDALREGGRYAEIVQKDLKQRDYQNVQWLEGAMDDYKALAEVFEESDFVIVSLESYSPKILHAVNQASVIMNKPWMSTFVDGSEAIIGPIYYPGETPCYNEFEIQREAVIGLKDDYIVYKEHLLESDLHDDHMVIPPYIHIVTGWTMAAVMQYLVTGQSHAVGRSVHVDLERMSIDYTDVLKLPRCPGCGKTNNEYRHTFL